MYIKQIEITNIRSIKQFKMVFSRDLMAGWHVLIGDNGSGKSTVLRSIALALIGVNDASGLRQDWSDWLARDSDSGDIFISLEDDTKYDNFTKSGAINRKNLSAGVSLVRNETNLVSLEKIDRKSRPATNRHVWGDGTGWFSASYGPFRRFSGGNSEYSRLFYTNPRLATHLSVFGEDVALSEALEWLKELNYKQLEKRSEGDILNPIRDFINQDGFLPHNTNLTDISSRGVIFTDANGAVVPVDNLSDGYRSILSMTFELIRQLQLAYPNRSLFSEDHTQVIVPGVVMIDEIDAHLHPSWQRRVGAWFIRHFPKMQFIVTTHSPLVCQAAIYGTIWRLSAPGSEYESYQVERHSEEWKRLVYGNVLEAYSTDLFGEDIDRSPEAQEKYDRVAELSTKDLDEGLTNDEETELDRLMEDLPQTPYKHIIGAGDD